MELCDRIKSLRMKKLMTQRELGIRIKVSEVSIRSWETGLKKPSMSAIVALANVFNVTTDYLLGVSIEPEKDDMLLTQQEITLLHTYRDLDKFGKKAVDTLCALEKSRVTSQRMSVHDSETISIKSTASRCIPLYATPAAAGRSIPLDNDDFELIPVNGDTPNGADFAVRIQGDSMNPYILDGDIVYIKKDCELSIGDVGIFCVDGAMYCKQYYIDEDRNLSLISANPKYKDTNIYVSADSGTSVRCYGKVLLGIKLEIPDYFVG